MSARNRFHVRPAVKGWEAVYEDGRNVSSGSSHAETLEDVRELAKCSRPSTIVIHDSNGHFEHAEFYQVLSDPESE